MKTRNFVALIALVICHAANAQEIATCRNPTGMAFRHFNGLQDKATAGWSEDKIGNGVVTLVRGQNGVFDLLYTDVRQKPISMTLDGAIIRLLRFGSDQISFLVYYEESATEIYSFFTEKDGTSRFTMMTSRLGPKAIFPKSGVMAGECNPIRFDLLKQ